MSDKKINIDPGKIHLNYIEEISVSIDNSIDLAELKPSLTIDVAHTTGHIIKENKFLFGLKLVFSTSNNNPKKEDLNCECKFRYNFHYIIDNLSEMFEINEDGNPVFKKAFVATIAGISYSTLRGIIFEKTSNSNWTSLVIPVIDPSLLLDSWISQD